MLNSIKKLYENNHEEQLEQVEEPVEEESGQEHGPNMDEVINPNESIQEVSAEVEADTTNTEEPHTQKDSSFSFGEFFDSNSPQNYQPDLSSLKNLTGKDDLFDVDHVQQEIETFISNGTDKSIDLAVNPKNRDPKINKRAMEDFVDYLYSQFSKVIDPKKKITPGSKKLLDELRKSYAIFPNGKVGLFKFLLSNKDKFFSGAPKKAKKSEEKESVEEVVEESQQVPQEKVSQTLIDTSWLDDNNDSYNETADPTLNFNRGSLYEEYLDVFRMYNGIPKNDFKKVDLDDIERHELEGPHVEEEKSLQEDYERNYRDEYNKYQKKPEQKKPGLVGTK